MPKTKQTQLHELALHYHATLYLIIQEKDEKSITFIATVCFWFLTLDSNDLYFTLLSLRSQILSREPETHFFIHMYHMEPWIFSMT